jgi:hypothetical protein
MTGVTYWNMVVFSFEVVRTRRGGKQVPFSCETGIHLVNIDYALNRLEE